MFVFLLQVRHTLEDGGRVYLFAVFSTIVWLIWIIKVVLSRRYRPWTAEHVTTASVLVPVVDEPVQLFGEVLQRIVEQEPHETIVIINGPANPALEQVCQRFPAVTWVWTPIAGKRNAVRVGTEMATGEIVVLVDSDTVWTEGTLRELVKPFADKRIGGVTTRQRILDYRRSLITRWADWLENSRALYSMPAQSVLGQVGCLPGRTIAFRREILTRAMPEFLAGRFLGVFLEVSDDRTLTNLTLLEGYRTVYQSTSLVYTDAPLSWRTLFKQQLRWSRGSQYNTLRMLPWMVSHAPLLAVFFLVDIVLPFLLLGVVIGWVYRSATGTGINFYSAFLETYGVGSGVLRVVVLMIVISALSMGIRQLRHLAERPMDIFWMPVFVLVSSLFLMPIRLLGFFRLAHAGSWGTRANAYTAEPDTVNLLEQRDWDEPGAHRDPLLDELHGLSANGPADIVDREDIARRGAAALHADPEGTRSGHSPAGVRTDTATAETKTSVRLAHTRPPDPTTARRPNLLAGIPYLIGFTIVAAEVAYHG
jgi:hyaluronan synthase